MKTTAHVPHLLALLHLYLWEIITSVSQATLGPLKPSGTWMILCGTHRDVQVGALVVTVVGHGSLPHCTRMCEMTFMCAGARVE